MNNQFDEVTKGLAQSVTRRGAFKKFGFGLAAMTFAALGLANRGGAAKGGNGGGNKACNHCRYPYGCYKLPLDQQAGCITYCNGLCGGY